MNPQNKHLVAINTIFTIHEKKYKVLREYDWKQGQVYRWVIRPMYGGKDFLKKAWELDKILRKHKAENNHLLYDVNL